MNASGRSGAARPVRALPAAMFAACLTLAACGSHGTETTHAAAGPQHPDVVLIIVDDLSSHVGLYGYPAQTPALERLAARGRRFDHAYAQYPLCNPSRTSLFTGWRPERTGVWGNLRDPAPYIADAVPLQEYFARNGYYTVRVGKAFHSRFSREFHWSQTYETYGDEETEDSDSARWGVAQLPEDQLPDGRAVSKAIEVLSQHPAQPLFLVLGLLKPHAPWVAPEKYFRLYPPGEVVLPASADERAGEDSKIPRKLWPEAIAAYHAAVSFADAQVGKVLDALQASGHLDDTIVVVTSDHGLHLGEHGLFGKNTLYEESARVPLVIAAPGLQHPGVPTGAMAELVDLYPTLLDLCGLPPLAGLDGVSLRPLLEDPSGQVKEAAFTMKKVGATRRRQIALSIRTQRYRYMLWPDGSESLYDHQTDPEELHDLARQPGQQQVLARLRRLRTQLPPIRQDLVLPKPDRARLKDAPGS